MTDFIGKQIRRCNRNALIVAVLLLLPAVLALSLSRRWVYNVFNGPFPMTVAELRKVDDAKGLWKHYVKAQAEKPAIDTGQREGTTKAGLTTKFLLLPVGHRWLLLKMPLAHEGTEYVGYLTPVTGASENDLINQLEARQHGLKDLVLPYELDGVYTYKTQFWAMMGLMAVPAVAGLWILALLLLRFVNPARHPVLRALAAYGDAEEVRRKIDMDFLGSTLRIGRLRLTHDWLVSLKFWSVDVAPVEDVVWAYKLVVRGSGASIQAVVCTRRRARFGIIGKDDHVGAMLRVLNECVPWAVIGYDANLDNLWNTDPGRFIAAVDERRRKMATAPPGAPEAAPPTDNNPGREE